LIEQALLLSTQTTGPVLPEVGWPTLLQAELLREWNQLDAALALAEEAIALCKQTASLASLIYLLCGNAVLLRICLSRGELEAAYSAFQQIEWISGRMNHPTSTYDRSFFTTVDQVRLWLACGEQDHAMRWAQELDTAERSTTPFVREREDVAHVRILLASKQSALALKELESVLERATAGQRWGHVIEIRLLQALAYQMLHDQRQALDVLSEAVRLAEPEGYIRSFVDEGAQMEALLYQLRKRDRRNGPTPYLDRLLTAFQQECMAHVQGGEPSKAQRLSETLSERELQVLQLLARGASNLEIAQELVIAIDTVKRHVSHIFAKLGVQNRIQTVWQAQELGLLDEDL
jgi:LuxR family maltose regulon positive regulatory protein